MQTPSQSAVNNQSSVIPQKTVIWVVNPFDGLPNATDVPLRYWALCRTLAIRGNEVIWWSSDFSHLTKSKRQPCPPSDGFNVRLIKTSPYLRNISFARLKNHRKFANGFYCEAIAALRSGELQVPNRIIISLPPLGVAEQAFRIRNYVNNQSSPVSHQDRCKVVVDIMDAWPETFYQVIPKPLRSCLGPLIFAPMHRSARRALKGADKISAVGQSYLDLANCYLATKRQNKAQKGFLKQKATSTSHSSLSTYHSSSAKPMMLCYHGTDLSRFQRDRSESETVKGESDQSSVIRKVPLRAVYLGAMGSGYDLMTIIEVAARWKVEGIFPFQIHFAGDGPQLEKLKAESEALGLLAENSNKKAEVRSQSTDDQRPRTDGGSHPETSDKSVAYTSTIRHQRLAINDSERIVFHGFLNKAAINELLLSSDLALVPNRPVSLVACPYKAGEYAAASLPMLSCLGGELNDLLKQWKSGSRYKEGDSASLHAAFERHSTDLDLLKEHSLNARKMAEALFDRKQTYRSFAEFVIS